MMFDSFRLSARCRRGSELLFLCTGHGRGSLPRALALCLRWHGRCRCGPAEGALSTFLQKTAETLCSASRILAEALKDYPPGQQEIDGGGFEIKKMDLEKGYIYVQFESLKRGYIDDVEFLVKPTDKESGQVLVRSASRLGYLDLGVNAKRLNRLSQALRDVPNGRWTAPKISQALFPRPALPRLMQV